MAAERGAKVVLVSRDADALVRIVREIEEAGGQAEFASADVGDLRDVQRAAAKAVERFGRIDTWVNDAGVAIYAKLVDTPMDEHEEMVGTNYFGVVNGSLTAVEHYEIARYGTLIAWAKELGRDDCAAVLDETLAEEKATDDTLTRLAETQANARAAMATADA